MHKTLPSLVLAVLLLAACVSANQPEPSPATTFSQASTPSLLLSPSPSVEPSYPPAPEGESASVAEVRKAWERYQDVTNQAYASLDSDLAPVVEITTGQHQVEVVNWVSRNRAAGQILSGSIITRRVQVTEPQANEAGVMVSTVTACQDRTKSEAVNADTGDPIPSSPGWERVDGMEILNIMEKGSDGVWRASHWEGKKATC